MKKEPQLFNAKNVYRLIREMVKAVDLDMPKRIIAKDSRVVISSLEHVDLHIVRESPPKSAVKGPQIPYLMMLTKPSNLRRGPQRLLTLRFTQTDIRQTLHEHTVVGTMEMPTDYSMLNALKLVQDMRDAVETFIYEDMGVTGFHEVFAPIQKRHKGESQRFDKQRVTIQKLKDGVY